VVCSTCTGAGDERRLRGLRFRRVIIDEATQATEPAVLIPLVRAHRALPQATPFTETASCTVVGWLVLCQNVTDSGDWFQLGFLGAGFAHVLVSVHLKD
jgi:hypothetical protein